MGPVANYGLEQPLSLDTFHLFVYMTPEGVIFSHTSHTTTFVPWELWQTTAWNNLFH